jgi:hypothetical protein
MGKSLLQVADRQRYVMSDMLYINNVQKTRKIRYNRKPFFCDMF